MVRGRRRKESGLEGKTADLTKTLTEKDVREVVYSVADQSYMQAYIGMLQQFKDKGIIDQEPDLEYVSNRTYQKLHFCGMFSILSRSGSNRKKDVLVEFTKDEKGVPTKYTIQRHNGYALFCKDTEVLEMIPVRLIRALRTRELRNLNDLGEIDPVGRIKSNASIRGSGGK